MAPPTLDVVVVSYRNQDTIERLLRSLPRISGFTGMSIFLHDNSNDRELLDLGARVCHELGVIGTFEACPENCGFARACNNLAWQGRGDWILFINPDAEVVEFPVAWAPSAGIWGPEIVDGSLRRVQLYGVSRGLSAEFKRMLLRRDKRPTGHGYVSGACLLIDRRSFSELRGFDERFYMFYEDIDLGLRASVSGIPVNVNPNWTVMHLGGHSSVSGRERVLRISARSSTAFHLKHGHWWRGWAAGMGSYFKARSVIARHSDVGASDAFSGASREYFRILRLGASAPSTGECGKPGA